MLSLSKKTHILLITLLGALVFIPFLGSVHLFDWDEINFAECAREMIASNDYSNVKINFQPFWEKPPLFIWLQVLSMKIFGINEFAARFPNAICGILTLNIVYLIGSTTHNKKFGLFWTLAFAGSILPYFYFKTGVIDPWFNLFIFLGVYQAILHTNSPQGKNAMQTAILCALFIGLATLTKGPVAVLIFGLCAFVFWTRKKFTKVSSIKYLLIFVLVFILTAGSWFFYEILSGNLQVIKDFFVYQVRLFKEKDAGHGGFFAYHFVVLLVGCFPASVFMLRGFKKTDLDTPFQIHFKTWMSTLFWVVLILFTIVQTKIVHYSSLCYFPLTWFAANGIYQLTEKTLELKKWMSFLLIGLGCVIGIVFTLFTMLDVYKNQLINSNLIKDKFAVDCLAQPIAWQGWEWIMGLLFTLSSLFFIYKIIKLNFKFIPHLFISNLVCVFFLLVFIAPKIEAYIQKPSIDFYKALQNKDCYVETANYKSFAHLFYTAKKPEHNSIELLKFVKEKIEMDTKTGQEVFSFSLYSINWMKSANITKPAFFVVKSTDAQTFLKENPSCFILYQKGGFVFFKRNPIIIN